MIKIKAKSLSPEAFRKYGVYQDLLDDASMGRNCINPSGFFPDLIALNFASTTLPSVCCCSVSKQERNIVRSMEAHQYTCEGLLPIDGDVIIFVGTLPPTGLTVETLEAFVIPKGTFVKLNPLNVHGTQYCVDMQRTHILCMLPERTFRNDKIGRILDDENDMAEIVL